MCEKFITIGGKTTEPYGTENLITTRTPKTRTRTTFVAIGNPYKWNSTIVVVPVVVAAATAALTVTLTHVEQLETVGTTTSNNKCLT